MQKDPEKNKSIDPREIFELLQMDVQGIPLKEMQQNQTHPHRLAFISNLVSYLRSYNKENGNVKPEGYYDVLKGVLSSKTKELIELIQTCQEGWFGEFVAAVKDLDRESLRRLGEKQTPKSKYEDEIPDIVKGKRTAFTDVLASRGTTAEDIRTDAARKRQSLDWQ